MVPCIVNSALNVCALTTVWPGPASWSRIRSASTPPSSRKANAEAPYRMPIRLWSTVVAAYLALQAPREYRCDYLGVLPLAKGFGAAPLYRLRRATR